MAILSLHEMTGAEKARLRERQRAAEHPRWTREQCAADELLYLQRRLRGVLEEMQGSDAAALIETTDAIDLVDDALSHLSGLTDAASYRADEPPRTNTTPALGRLPELRRVK